MCVLCVCVFNAHALCALSRWRMMVENVIFSSAVLVVCCSLFYYFIAKCIMIFSSCSASFPAISCLFAELNHWISKIIDKRNKRIRLKLEGGSYDKKNKTFKSQDNILIVILKIVLPYIINVNFCFGGCFHKRAIELLCKLFS